MFDEICSNRPRYLSNLVVYQALEEVHLMILEKGTDDEMPEPGPEPGPDPEADSNFQIHTARHSRDDVRSLLLRAEKIRVSQFCYVSRNGAWVQIYY